MNEYITAFNGIRLKSADAISIGNIDIGIARREKANAERNISRLEREAAQLEKQIAALKAKG